MARFYGTIGFIETVEDPIDSGIWVEKITERHYYGEIVKNSRKWQGAENLNDNLNIANEFLVTIDEYALQNFHAMRYLEFMGVRWKITNITVEHPHLRLTVGGVYNGGQQTT